MPDMSYEQFMELVRERHAAEGGEWRFGQAYFNVLCEVAPKIAEQIRSTPQDPFFREKVAPLTHYHVMELWHE